MTSNCEFSCSSVSTQLYRPGVCGFEKYYTCLPCGISPRFFGIGKLEYWAMVYDVVCVILCFAVLVQYRRATDGHTTTAHTTLA